MKKRAVFFSPFMAYCFTFLLALLVYTLDWSYLYPPLSVQLLVFFACTFCMAVLTALLLAPFRLIAYQEQMRKITVTPAWFLIIGYVLDCAWSHNIPLIALATGATTYEELRIDFGIPTFHVLLVGYNAFIAVFYFHSYLSQKRKKILALFLLTLIFPLLIMSRITLTIIVIACFYVYLFSAQKNVAARLGKLMAAGLLFLMGFGLLGNIRTAADVSADDVFLAIGDARDGFRESNIPKSFFWGFIYISSPLANLQLTMDTKDRPLSQNDGAGNFFVHEFLWDAISKKYDKINNTGPVSFTQINDAFNVGSIFARPYVYAGLAGMTMIFLFVLAISLLFILLLDKRSPYYVTYICFFNGLVVLCMFDNMLIFTPFSLVILFPLIEKFFSFIVRKPSYAP